ncbi:MAG: HAMP domain-containing protein [Planctomycetes bacterium]|nr:HAMP domain-containing protein [Planctomycetota bacterium]
MRPFRNAPIRVKLTLLLVGVVSIALLLSYAVFVVNDVRMIQEATRNHLSALADVVGSNTTAALNFTNAESAAEVLGSLKLEPTVVYARLYDERGDPFAEYPGPTGVHRTPPPLPAGETFLTQDGYLHVFQPIMQEGQSIGTIYLQASRAALYGQLRQYAIIVVAGMSLSLAIMVVVATRLQRVISRPIQHLVDAAQTVSAKADYSTRVMKESDDELGVLCEAFNSMLSQIQQRDAELAQHRQNLEQLVQERTQSLEHKTAELEDSNSELIRSNTELQQFAFIASHDLQEPLRKVQAFGDLLVNKYQDKIDDEGRDYLKRMQTAATRMRALIDGLLSYSRIASKGQPFTSVNLHSVLQNVLSDLESRIEQTGGKVECDGLPTIEADALQMQQLLQNLIGNGLKFCHPDVPPLVTIRSRPYRNNGQSRRSTSGLASEECEITVQDNGVGFDQQFAERMFQPFQRLHGRDQFEGTGMGLAICRKIVERHGGRISGTSPPGQGAAFVITLPVTQSFRTTGTKS